MRPYGFRPRAWDFDGADKPVAVVDEKRARREGRLLAETHYNDYEHIPLGLRSKLDSAPEPEESVKTQEKS